MKKSELVRLIQETASEGGFFDDMDSANRTHQNDVSSAPPGEYSINGTSKKLPSGLNRITITVLVDLPDNIVKEIVPCIKRSINGEIEKIKSGYPVNLTDKSKK